MTGTYICNASCPRRMVWLLVQRVEGTPAQYLVFRSETDLFGSREDGCTSVGEEDRMARTSVFSLVSDDTSWAIPSLDSFEANRVRCMWSWLWPREVDEAAYDKRTTLRAALPQECFPVGGVIVHADKRYTSALSSGQIPVHLAVRIASCTVDFQASEFLILE